MVRLGAVGLVAAIAVGFAGVAAAAPFTLKNPVAITGAEAGNPGVVGTLNPVTDLTGALLATSGTVNGGFAGQDVFAVDLTLAGGSAPVDKIEITVGATGVPFGFLNIAGAGAFDDTPGDIGPSVVTLDLVGFEGDFTFAPNVMATETTVRLFVVYPAGNILEDDTVTFRISSGTNFMVQGLVLPEPSTFLLVAFGLAGLATVRRR